MGTSHAVYYSHIHKFSLVLYFSGRSKRIAKAQEYKSYMREKEASRLDYLQKDQTDYLQNTVNVDTVDMLPSQSQVLHPITVNDRPSVAGGTWAKFEL